ncbi:Rz1 family lipoprotein [Klebsiella pneumoniae]|uniref:Rz1 family lipoprotein n=1 Tax=Klebsiella pneumoniae TaxID=573 RepID=UPI002556009C|nr:Rz1 family lipoprotein [Klebsiella pneumoniae]MDK9487830.1 Rz1 family lipoprotein [Klebsiella pneumoniae]
MEKAQELQQMLNSIITVSEVETTGKTRRLTTCRSTSGRNAFDDSDNFTHHPSHLAL